VHTGYFRPSIVADSRADERTLTLEIRSPPLDEAGRGKRFPSTLLRS